MNIFDDDRVSKLGEKAMIKRVCAALGASCPPPPFGSGDDCALIDGGALAGNLYLTVDSLVYGRHFDASTPPDMAGEKLLKRNISDIASMGARPKKAVCAAVLSGGVSAAWLEAFASGLARAARRFGVEVVGGDFADAGAEKFFAMSLTLLGDGAGKPLLRRAAKEGDFIYTTGGLGLSLESGHHLNFVPRVEEGAFLAEYNASGAGAKITSCTDISDGLASDIENILPDTLSAAVDFLPLREGASPANALSDGEDYELLFSLSGGEAAAEIFEGAYARKFGAKPFRLGRAQKKGSSAEPPILLKAEDGSLKPFGKGGYEHFTSTC